MEFTTTLGKLIVGRRAFCTGFGQWSFLVEIERIDGSYAARRIGPFATEQDAEKSLRAICDVLQ